MANEMDKSVADELAALTATDAVDLSSLRAKYPEASDLEFGMAVQRARDYLRQEYKIELMPRRGRPGVLERADSEHAARRGHNQEKKSVRALMRSKGNYEVAMANAANPTERAVAEAKRNKLADLSIDVATRLRQRARRLQG